MVTALRHGLESSVHPGDVGAGSRQAQHTLRRHQYQERRIGLDVAADQVDGVLRSPLVEQEFAVVSEQEIIVGCHPQGSLEVRVGRVRLAHACGGIGHEAFNPGLDRNGYLWTWILDHRHQRVGLRGMSSERAQRCGTHDAHEIAAGIGEMNAGVVGQCVIALDHANRGQRQPGLGVARIAFENLRQFLARRLKEMPALLDGGMHHQHRDGWRRLLHAGSDDGHRAAQKTGITGGSSVVDVGQRQGHRFVHIVRVLSKVVAQLNEVAHPWVGGRRYELKHHRRVGRYVGCGLIGLYDASGQEYGQRSEKT